MAAHELTARGVAALRAGDRAAARALLAAAVRADPADATAWLWLSGALDDPAAQRECLRRALVIDPGCAPARAGLAALGGERETGRQGDRESRESRGFAGATGGVSSSPRLLVSASGRSAFAWAPWVFAAVAGVGAALAWGAWRGLGAELASPELLALAVVAGVPGGLVVLLLAGVLLRVGGRLIGGRAGAAEVRAALGWSLAPAAAGLPLWLAQLALLPASFGGPPAGPGPVAALWVVHAGLWAWSAARSLAGLGSAHGLPVWRAAAAWLIAALALVVGVGALLGGAALVIGLRGG